VGLELGVGLSGHGKFGNGFVLNESSSMNGFHHSRKAIQLRTHLSNEAFYQQHSDSNGTYPLFLGIKLDPKIFLKLGREHLTDISQK